VSINQCLHFSNGPGYTWTLKITLLRRCKLRRTLIGTCVFILSLYVAAPCSAGIITASGAGSTLATAMDLTGAYPTEIVGALSGTDLNDASVFKINLQSMNFSALTVFTGAFGIPDTVLSLFDSTGVGVYLNDDISVSNFMSCLPSSVASNPCPASGIVLPGGIYYLAISRGANYPLDGLGNEIFNPLSSTDLVGPSSTNPLASWDGGAFTSPDFDLVNYQIDLTGTVPEPATWLLTAGAVLALGRLRRRR
jgi:hypothetical protein